MIRIHPYSIEQFAANPRCKLQTEQTFLASPIPTKDEKWMASAL